MRTYREDVAVSGSVSADPTVYQIVFKKGWTNRAATVRACRPPQARFSHPKPYRFLTGAALKEAS